MTPSLTLTLLAVVSAGVCWLAWRYPLKAKVVKNEQRMPRCGACGYPTRGIAELVCPECGADLREVGIRPPGARRDSRLGAAVLWSLLVLILGGVMVPLLFYNLAPIRAIYHQRHELYRPASGAFTGLTLTQLSSLLHSPFAGGRVVRAAAPVTIRLQKRDGSSETLEVQTSVTGTWHVMGGSVGGGYALNQASLVAWLVRVTGNTASAADGQAVEVLQQLGEMTRATYTLWPGSRSSSGSGSWYPSASFANLNVQTSTDIRRSPLFLLMLVLIALGIWGYGLRRIMKGGAGGATTQAVGGG